jgi:predicted RNase H-like nuclease
MTTTFIGIDLAWSVEKNNTGVAVLRGGRSGASLVESDSGVTSMSGIVALVAKHATDTTVIAIDAPLIVKNRTGSRPCEKEIGRRFGKFHASCHSSNLARNPHPAGVRLVSELGALGFTHDLDLTRARHRGGRWLFEVYPHPAMIVLFGLQQVIKYKQGKVAEKRAGLEQLQKYLGTLTARNPGPNESPRLPALLGQDPERLRGRDLKHHEDALDALFCAYLAYHCWCWGAERNEMIGDLETGYIVVPKRA